MFFKQLTIILSLVLILLLSGISLAQAAPPGQEGSIVGTQFGETLDLDGEEAVGHNNLGTIMSGRKDGDTLDNDPADGPPDDGDTEPAVKEHPVASAIAEHFEATGATYEEIMSLHEAGNGFGNIAKAYFFAADKFGLDMTPEQLLQAAHESGWGNLLKDNGIHPGSVGNGGGKRPEHAGRPENVGPGNDGPPGQVKKGNNLTGSATAGSELVGPGGNNGKGNNGNGKGNNGNGGGNGHGNNGNGRKK